MRWTILQERSEAYWPLGPAITTIAEVFTSDVKKIIGKNYGESAFIYLPRHQYFCINLKRWKNTEEHVMKKVDNNLNYSIKVKDKFQSFLQYFKRIYMSCNGSLDDKTNKQLWTLYNNYWKAYRKVYIWGEPFPFALRDVLFFQLETYLKKILKGIKCEKNFGEYFRILTTPLEKSFITREEESLLYILAQIQKHTDIKKLSKLNYQLFKKQLHRYQIIAHLIRKHTKNFKWLPFDYGPHEWDENHFIKVLYDMIKKNVDSEKRLFLIEEFYDMLPDKQHTLFKKLKIDEHHQKLFTTAQICSYLIDFKKEEFTKSHYIFQHLLDQIASRLQITKRAMRFTLPMEIKYSLLSNMKLDIKKLEKRSINAIFYSKSGKGGLIEGNIIQLWLKKEGFMTSQIQQVFEIRGLCACPGTALGKAKIIHSIKEIDKLERGDILIAYQTTPDYVRAMKNASAIVTNEGGMTSHAAIVSRELNIPCIVGTKNATKVFRDGDILEVKASHGIVRKLK